MREDAKKKKEAEVKTPQTNEKAKDSTEASNDQSNEPQQEEVKKVPRYFPPRKLPNPFDTAAQEQERFLQARKEALAKYSNISKNRFKQDES